MGKEKGKNRGQLRRERFLPFQNVNRERGRVSELVLVKKTKKGEGEKKAKQACSSAGTERERVTLSLSLKSKRNRSRSNESENRPVSRSRKKKTSGEKPEKRGPSFSYKATLRKKKGEKKSFRGTLKCYCTFLKGSRHSGGKLVPGRRGGGLLAEGKEMGHPFQKKGNLLELISVERERILLAGKNPLFRKKVSPVIFP